MPVYEIRQYGEYIDVTGNADKYAGYAGYDVRAVEEHELMLCAACHGIVLHSQAGLVTVGGNNPETVHVHNTDACRRGAKRYPRNFRDIKAERIRALEGAR